MNELNLSPREQIMFDTFKSKRGGVVSVDDLDDALRRNGEKPRGGSRSLTVSVRYLGFKLGVRGYVIRRVSELGRGNKAEYRMQRITNARR